MIRLKFITCGIISALLLISCSQILEPVSFFGGEQDIAEIAGQEEFNINIKSLTFDKAKNANNMPYSRKIIINGIGANAKVTNEANFLISNFPKPLSVPNYRLGIGDEILFTVLSEFETAVAQWPKPSKESEYLLGAGDTLIFAQSNDYLRDVSVDFSRNGKITPTNLTESIISTKGVIGSNGSILLFGLGTIQAANRTLDDVRNEVRNILIRNGLAPNFQLEIENFNSQRVFVLINDKQSLINDKQSQIYYLNNLPMSLKEVALKAGLSKSYQNFAKVKLTRSVQEYYFTAGQLFDDTAPEIILQDNDQIEIDISTKVPTNIRSIVGTKGNILLGQYGRIPAANQTLDEIYEKIRNILIKKSIKPNFQLELTKSVSQKAYLIQKNVGTLVVPLTNSKLTLRELILGARNTKISTTGLSIITLKRNGQAFRMTEDQILNPTTKDIWIFDGDQIELEVYAYKPGQVYVLSGSGSAQVVPINPSKRETLADVLFTGNGAFNNLSAKRSEVYLLRGKSPSVAYHLDAQNVSRILVAAKTELRPNDIVYVAERPIISFARTLAEINPLRILLRDIQNNDIP